MHPWQLMASHMCPGSTHLEADTRLLLPVLPGEGLQLHHGHADQTYAGRLDLVHALCCGPAAQTAAQAQVDEDLDQIGWVLDCGGGPWQDAPLERQRLQEEMHGTIMITQHH